MMTLRSIVVGALCGLVAPAASASAQRLSTTFDLSGQVWQADAEPGRYAADDGVGLEAVVTRRLRVHRRGALLVGGSVAVQGTMGAKAVCLIQPGATTTACAPDFPSFASLTALGGVEGTFGLTTRVLAGPAVFYAASRETAAGLQGHADLATPPLLHLSLVFSVRGAVIPSFKGRAHRYGAMGVGIGIR